MAWAALFLAVKMCIRDRIGGVSKGHPDEKDIAAAVEFYNGLTEQPVFLK